jgi:hypothetical protein
MGRTGDINAARDVDVGELWAFPEHQTMAEVIAEEATRDRRRKPLLPFTAL